MRPQEVPLKNVGVVLASCWERAETEMASFTRRWNPNCEEHLTLLLAGTLRDEVDAASSRGDFAEALCADVREVLGPSWELERSFDGLIARISFHSRAFEGRTSSADFGIAVLRPMLHLDPTGSVITTTTDHAIGILAQAKLRRPEGASRRRQAWGALTQRQKKLYPTRCNYLALLLYRLTGTHREELQPLAWQPCRDQAIGDVRNWLKTGEFPKEMPTAAVVHGLVAGTLGTSDRAELSAIVDPLCRSVDAVSIRMYWPDKKGPPSSVYVPSHGTRPEVHQTIRA